ncbi:MAG TPA: universal stress protein [Terracidiphilus sp.]|nr:universal stress protein [Terracidiphilus sp.]
MYSHILIGLNESAAALRALRQAIRLAATFNATLTAVAVTPSLPLYAAFATVLGGEARQIIEDDQQASLAGLLEIARREARQHDIEIETVLSSGPVIDSLFEAVRTNHIDLLVLGIHPGHGLPGFLSSGTAHELAEGAQCDVLGVH